MILVLSPHLDDAVLSVGALLSARAAAGEDVVVATIFSQVEDPRREDDDRAALGILGCHPCHLGLRDAPLRGVAKTTAALCGGEPDKDVVGDAGQAIAGLMGRERPRELWVPLAVGGHIDHVAVLRAALAASRRDAVTVLFEDRPYARRRGAVALAWSRLAAESVGSSGDNELDDVDDSVFFLDAVEAPPPPAIPSPTAVSALGTTWRRHAQVVDDVGRARRLRAIESYASEAGLLIGPRRDSRWPWSDAHEFTWRPAHA